MLNTRAPAPLLRQKRQLMGLSQEDVAKRCNITRNYYTRLENGTRNGSIEVWRSIGKALDIPDAELLQYIDNIKEGTSCTI